MDEISDYLLAARGGGHGAKTHDAPPSPAAAAPAKAPRERRDAGAAGTADLLDLLLARLGDETVRRAIARLLAPR